MDIARDYAYVADLLQSIDIAYCLFDAEDRALQWNARFLVFFPEHEGHIHVGEPYSANLQRFYAERLAGAERALIERYIEEGVARHRAQMRPFTFTHRGRSLRVASLPGPDGVRIRLWQELPDAGIPAQAVLNADGLENILDGAVILDETDRIVSANHEFRRLYSIPPGRAIVGLTMTAIVHDIWREAGELERNAAILDHMRFAGVPFDIELPGDRWRRVIARRAPTGFGYLTHSDTTALKRQERELRRAHDELATLALSDALTGVANRRRFDSAFDDAWHMARDEGKLLALMILDLDFFKPINDRFGHTVGDACLQRAARVIERASRRPTDLVARVGGDEFSLILPGANLAAARAVGDRIRTMMAAEPWTDIHADLPAVTFSIGLSHAPETFDTAAAMIGAADAALYRAKRDGRDRLEADAGERASL